MKKFILLILVCMLSSCSIAIMRNTQHTELFTNARIFQVLDSNEALIWDDNFNVAKIITSEEIYYWMTAQNIPFECQYWHLNRLITLIKICAIENKPKDKKQKKMTSTDLMARRASMDAARKKNGG